MSCNKKHNPEIGRGAIFCDCGDEIEAIAAEGCYKLHETNWLEEYPNNIPTDIFEVRFKNTRRSYYQNVNNLDLKRGDIVAVEAQPGHDIGIVSLTGDMVAKQMRRVGFNPHNGEFKKIYRKARPYDIEKWQEAIALEHETMIASRQIAADMGLNMKIGDVEYQGDGNKAIFYYIADERVDFRQLIKVLAEAFHVRIEMRQIGARQEAGRIGGIGPCGRELCCATWMTSFVSVATSAARFQDISLNPQKLAGQCAKLKCCLNYEVDSYVEALKRLPSKEIVLETKDGEFYFFKSDILKGMVTYSSDKHVAANLVELTARRAFEVINMNRRGDKPESLSEEEQVEEKRPVDLLEQENINRFDKAKKKKKKSKGGGGGGQQPSKQGQGAKPANQQTAAPKNDGNNAPKEGNGGKHKKRHHNHPNNSNPAQPKPAGGEEKK